MQNKLYILHAEKFMDFTTSNLIFPLNTGCIIIKMKTSFSFNQGRNLCLLHFLLDQIHFALLFHYSVVNLETYGADNFL